MQRFMRRQGLKAGMAAVAVTTAIATAACSSSSPASSGTAAGASTTASAGGSSTAAAGTDCSPGATKITFWAWAVGYNLVVNEFNKTHPNICVVMDDVGGGNAEYVKLSQALKAGNGAPDVAEVEYIELPSLEITHSLVNLANYGVDQYKSDVVPSAWSGVSQGSAVYAMPGDIGPLGLYYDTAELTRDKLTPPTTWTQFAADAATVHKDDPNDYITNFSVTDGEWLLALMQAFGAFPFQYSGGSNVTVDFTGPQEMAFANYWDSLLKDHLVNTGADMTAPFWNDLDNGTDASWLMAAWGPGYMSTNIKKTTGEWEAAALPQVTAGGDLEGSWGGSTAAVIQGTQHAQAAATFAEWFFGNMDAWEIHAGPVGQAFPGYTPLLNSKSFQNSTLPLSGNTKSQVVYSAEAKNITSVQWPPFMEEVLTDEPTAMAGVANGTQTMVQGLEALQKTVTAYATSQGFTVHT
jgi:multiple sugar transport system substrate-binding protein